MRLRAKGRSQWHWHLLPLLETPIGVFRATLHALIQPTPQVIQSILDPVAPGRSQAKPRSSPGAPNPSGFAGPFSFSKEKLEKALDADGPQRSEQHELREGEEQ